MNFITKYIVPSILLIVISKNNFWGVYRIFKEDNLSINNLKFHRSNFLIFVTIFIALAVIFSFGLCNVAAAAPGDIIYVNNSGGSDSYDGSSWSSAKQSISSATVTVNTNGTINIANGQYTGTYNTNITINKNMTIQGQSETRTIINGTGTNWIFHINSGISVIINNLLLTNTTRNHGGAIFNFGNLTINKDTFNNNIASSGGAIYNNGGTVTGTNNTFNNNTATYGGAICNNDGTVTGYNNTFNNNNADDHGGAIYNNGGTVTDINDTFNNNSAHVDGGAISNYGTLTVNSSKFTNNTAYSGGAICNNGGTVTGTNNTFNNNNADDHGGAICNNDGTVTDINDTFNNNSGHVDGGAISNYGTLTVINSKFRKNIADDGGAIYNEDFGIINLSYNTFTNNTAIYYGGALYNMRYGTLTENNNVFTNNTAPYGSISNFGTLIGNNDTFTNNNATKMGGAISNAGTLTNTNSIFTNNTTINDGGAIYNEGTITEINNIFKNNTAVFGGAIYSQGSNSVVKFCRIVGNTNNEIYSIENILDANLNWWGSNNNPSSRVNSYVNVTSWLVLSIKANPNTILSTGNSTITVDILHTNNGTLVSSIPNGVPVTFKTNIGNIANSTIINGNAKSTLNTKGMSGVATVSATVDNQIVTTEVTIKSPITPKVIKTNPKYHAINVPLTTPITITFNENIIKGINYNNIYVKNLNTGKIVHITKSLSNNTLTIKMTKSRLYNNKYIIYIPKSAFKDKAGNTTTAYTIPFKTLLKWK